MKNIWCEIDCIILKYPCPKYSLFFFLLLIYHYYYSGCLCGYLLNFPFHWFFGLFLFSILVFSLFILRFYTFRSKFKTISAHNNLGWCLNSKFGCVFFFLFSCDCGCVCVSVQFVWLLPTGKIPFDVVDWGRLFYIVFFFALLKSIHSFRAVAWIRLLMLLLMM